MVRQSDLLPHDRLVVQQIGERHAIQNVVDFLLKQQLSDGSWFVRTRAIPIQPLFDGGFPHGPDAFISAAGTNWAALALTAGLGER